MSLSELVRALFSSSLAVAYHSLKLHLLQSAPFLISQTLKNKNNFLKKSRMAVNSSTPPLHRSLHSRSPLVFFNRTGPGFFTHPPNPRLVSVRSHSQNSAPDGSGSKRSLSLEDSQTSIGSSSSAIDFLTLCHRLKVCFRSLTLCLVAEKT